MYISKALPEKAVLAAWPSAPEERQSPQSMGLVRPQALIMKTRTIYLPEIKEFYELPGIYKNAESDTKGKNGFEYFKDSTYDGYSISNSVYTSPTRLAGWIYAIQEVVYKSIGCDDNYFVKWRNKDRSDGAFVETELKVKQKHENGDLVHGLTIHMYLTTGTITFKGLMFHNFVDSNFKEIKEIAVKTLQDKEDERSTLETIPVTEAPTQSKLNTPVNQEIEHSILEFHHYI